MICDGLLLLPLACSLSASNEGSVPCIPYCLEVFFALFEVNFWVDLNLRSDCNNYIHIYILVNGV